MLGQTNDSVMLHAKWPGHTDHLAFWRPRPLNSLLPQVSKVGRMEICLLHVVLNRELDCDSEYTEKFCHDFCLGLFSFVSETSLTCSLHFLAQRYCLSNETLISFVISSKFSVRWCGTSFDLAIPFLGLVAFTDLSIVCPKKTYSNPSDSWKSLHNCLTHIQYSVKCLVPALFKCLRAGINSWN